MTYFMYAIRDQLTGYMQPTLDFSDASAQRNFAHAIQSSTGIMSFRPVDFDLMCLGTFNVESGVIGQDGPPRLVMNGLSAEKEVLNDGRDKVD